MAVDTREKGIEAHIINHIQPNTTNSKLTMVYRHGGQERQMLTAVWQKAGFSASMKVK
jgi:hypothetical protein